MAKQGKTINRNAYNGSGQRIQKADATGAKTNYYYENGSVLYTWDLNKKYTI